MIEACGPVFDPWMTVLFLQLLVGIGLLPAVLPSVLVTVWHDRRVADRARRGACRRCGYDLRATPWRCPECGLRPPPRAAGFAPRAMVVCAYP